MIEIDEPLERTRAHSDLEGIGYIVRYSARGKSEFEKAKSPLLLSDFQLNPENLNRFCMTVVKGDPNLTELFIHHLTPLGIAINAVESDKGEEYMF